MPFIDEITAETPVSMLTVGQLCQILGKNIPTQIEIHQAATQNLVRGYKGLAVALDVSKDTVWKWVKSGMYDEAITRDGRIIHFDLDKINEIRKTIKTGGRNK